MYRELRMILGAGFFIGALTWIVFFNEAEATPTFENKFHEESIRHKGLLQSIEDYLNQLKTLSAFFVQMNPDGTFGRGRFWMQRPGKLRLDYLPPTPLLMVADGHRFYQLDKETGDWDDVSLKDTPASIILQPHIQFQKDVQVTRIFQGRSDIQITVVKSKDPDAGSLTLIFQENPLRLKGWVVKDAQGDTTHIQLDVIKENINIPENLFQIPK